MPPLSLTNPTDLIAAIPYLIGFHPRDSLVVVAVAQRGRGQTVRCSARCDLPAAASGAPAVAEVLIQPVRQVGADFVVLIGYGAPSRVTSCVDAVNQALAEADIELRDVFRLTDGRYYSYMCHEECCPAAGVPFEPKESLVPVTMVAAGLSACGDRAELAATLDPVTGAQRDAVGEAAQLIEDRLGSPDALCVLGIDAVRSATASAVDGCVSNDPRELAWLLVTLRDLRVRDEAWGQILPGNAQCHLRLWQHVFRNAEPAYQAAPGSLAAFAAWQCGQGALANLLLDRVLSTDPDYTMAALLCRALQYGIPPQRWREIVPQRSGGSDPA